jgi:hypothetical protein
MLGPLLSVCIFHLGTFANHISVTAKRKEKQAKRVALAIATLT